MLLGGMIFIFRENIGFVVVVLKEIRVGCWGVGWMAVVFSFDTRKMKIIFVCILGDYLDIF